MSVPILDAQLDIHNASEYYAVEGLNFMQGLPTLPGLSGPLALNARAKGKAKAQSKSRASSSSGRGRGRRAGADVPEIGAGAGRASKAKSDQEIEVLNLRLNKQRVIKSLVTCLVLCKAWFSSPSEECTFQYLHK